MLTAAHCVDNRADWDVRVHLAKDLLAGGSSVHVDSWRVHPTQDLAALFLEDGEQPTGAPLPWSGDLIKTPQANRLNVTGYGGPDDDVSQCLRVTVGVRDINLDPFKPSGTRYAVLLDGGAYHGDSGGPMLFTGSGGPLLVGIHSGTTGGAVSAGSLSFTERLLSDDPWLLDVMPTPPSSIP